MRNIKILVLSIFFTTVLLPNMLWADEKDRKSHITGSVNIKLDVGNINNILTNTTSSKGRVNIGHIKQSTINGNVNLDKIQVGEVINELENTTNSRAKVKIGTIRKSTVNVANIRVDVRKVENKLSGGQNNHGVVRIGTIENSTVNGKVDIDYTSTKNITNTISGGSNSRSEVSIGSIVGDDEEENIDPGNMLYSVSQNTKPNIDYPMITIDPKNKEIDTGTTTLENAIQDQNLAPSQSGTPRKIASSQVTQAPSQYFPTYTPEFEYAPPPDENPVYKFAPAPGYPPPLRNVSFPISNTGGAIGKNPPVGTINRFVKVPKKLNYYGVPMQYDVQKHYCLNVNKVDSCLQRGGIPNKLFIHEEWVDLVVVTSPISPWKNELKFVPSGPFGRTRITYTPVLFATAVLPAAKAQAMQYWKYCCSNSEKTYEVTRKFRRVYFAKSPQYADFAKRANEYEKTNTREKSYTFKEVNSGKGETTIHKLPY